jgi:large conductance mechanosensitive channel
VIGGVDFKDLAWSLGTDPAGEPILVKYGVFLQNIFDFVVIAAAIFLALRAINKLKTPPPPAADPAPTPDVVLLGEIRDLLKTR